MRRFKDRHDGNSLDNASNYICWDRAAEDEVADWWIALGRNRDSDLLTESNWDVALERLGGEGENVQIHRFGHWACGWYELMLVRPDTAQAVEAHKIADDLAGYPVLDENEFSDREYREATRVWEECYRPKERIEYIRENREQFEFRGFADLLGSVRGRHFGGYPSELLG